MMWLLFSRLTARNIFAEITSYFNLCFCRHFDMWEGRGRVRLVRKGERKKGKRQGKEEREDEDIIMVFIC